MNTATVLYNFVHYLNIVLTGAIIIRVLMSWFSMGGYAAGPVVRLLDEITEPILGPLRRLMPSLGSIDLSPIVAILAINFITRLIEGQLLPYIA